MDKIQFFKNKLQYADTFGLANVNVNIEDLRELLALQEQPKEAVDTSVDSLAGKIEEIMRYKHREPFDNMYDKKIWDRKDLESILKEYGTSPSTCCRCGKGFAEDDVCCECIKNMGIVEHRNHVLDEAIEAIRKAKEVAKEQIDEITTEMIQKKAKKLLNM